MVRLVVLAGGKATRMGQDKLALPWGDSTVLAWVVQNCLQATLSLNTGTRVAELVVVARHPMDYYLPPDLQADFEESGGMWLWQFEPRPLADNLRAGLSGAHRDLRGIGYVPGDQIGVNSDILAAMLSTFLREEPDFLVPVSDGVPGAPVLFHHKFFGELLALQGEVGGKKVLAGQAGRRVEFSVPQSFLVDLDTPEDYEKNIESLLQRG